MRGNYFAYLGIQCKKSYFRHFARQIVLCFWSRIWKSIRFNRINFIFQIMKSKEPAIKRINRVLKFYELRGTNKESVNSLYRKIVKLRLEKS